MNAADSVEGISGRFDLVEGLDLGRFDRDRYHRMIAQMGGIVSRPFYGHGSVRLRPFSINLPEDRLLEAMGTRLSQMSLGEEPGRLAGHSGISARDGSESYRLSQVDFIFEEGSNPPDPGTGAVEPLAFMFYFDIRVGSSIPETYIQAAPADRSRQRYWASIQVVWDKAWSFFIAPTTPFATELRERVLGAHGFDIGPPPYTVGGRRTGDALPLGADRHG